MVGAQHVGKHVGVEAVVFVPGGAIAQSQCLDLPAGDHHDLQGCAQQCVDRPEDG
jgi:hypothetical protein